MKKFARFVAAAAACIALGTATPALAQSRGAHPNTSYSVNASGYVSQVYCSGGAVQFTGSLINDAASSVSGTIRWVVDGVNYFGDSTQGAAAGTSVGESGSFGASYTTAYTEYVPSGSTWKIAKIRIDYPNNKNCA